MDIDDAKTIELIALAKTFLARVYLEQGKVEDASAIMDQMPSFAYQPVIQVRIDLITGDIAYKKKQYQEAIKYYEGAYRISLDYATEGCADWDIYHRWGLACLTTGNLLQAEALFNHLIEKSYPFTTIETIRAKYGLACIYKSRGDKNKACILAKEALDELKIAVNSHGFFSQIEQLLKDLDCPE